MKKVFNFPSLIWKDGFGTLWHFIIRCRLSALTFSLEEMNTCLAALGALIHLMHLRQQKNMHLAAAHTSRKAWLLHWSRTADSVQFFWHLSLSCLICFHTLARPLHICMKNNVSLTRCKESVRSVYLLRHLVTVHLKIWFINLQKWSVCCFEIKE